MFKQIVTAFFMLTSYTQAKDLTIISNASSNGFLAQLIQENVKEFKDSEIKVRLTNTNCALTKSLWNNVSGPAILLYSTGFDAISDKTNDICHIKPTNDNLLYIGYSSPAWFCSVGNKTWEDFIKIGSSHIIGLATPPHRSPENLMNLIAKHYDTKLRLVRIHSNAEFLTLAKAAEIDFGLRTGIYGTFKDKCFWNIEDILSKESLSFLKPHVDIYNNLYDDAIYLYKNITPEQVIDFRNKIHSSQNSDTVKTLLTRRGHDSTKANYKTEEERLAFFERILKRYE